MYKSNPQKSNGTQRLREKCKQETAVTRMYVCGRVYVWMGGWEEFLGGEKKMGRGGRTRKLGGEKKFIVVTVIRVNNPILTEY